MAHAATYLGGVIKMFTKACWQWPTRAFADGLQKGKPFSWPGCANESYSQLLQSLSALKDLHGCRLLLSYGCRVNRPVFIQTNRNKQGPLKVRIPVHSSITYLQNLRQFRLLRMEAFWTTAIYTLSHILYIFPGFSAKAWKSSSWCSRTSRPPSSRRSRSNSHHLARDPDAAAEE